MKVLVLTNMYPYEGNPSYGIFVKEQVHALQREGVKVDVLFINAVHQKLTYVSGVIQFLRRCRAGQYDLIHTQHTFCAAIALLQRKAPVILTFHEGEASATLQMKLREIIRRPHKWLVCSFNLKKLIIRLVDQVIFVERRSKELFRNSKGVVIPCGVDYDLFRPMPAKLARATLGLSKPRRLVLFPSNPKTIGKRFDIAEEAIRIVEKRGADVELITLNNIPHREVPLYMNASDAMLFTSDYEASPMVIKEAMACNLPVIYTDVGDAKQIIGNTEGCFVCHRENEDIAGKIRLVLDHGKRTGGRKRIEELGLEIQQVAKNIIRVYEGCLVHRKMTSQNNHGRVRRSKRVCIVRRAYYPEETHTRRNVETLLRNGYCIDVICERDTNQLPYEQVKGVNVFRLPVRHKRRGALAYIVEYIFFVLGVFMMVTWLQPKRRYDVVEIETMPDFLVFAALVTKLLGSKVILYLFEDMPELMASKFSLASHNFIIRFLAWIERLSANYADHVIVCHELSRQKLLYKREVRTPITVILNVPNEGTFAPTPRAAKRTHLSDTSFTIIHHGTMTENYGIHTVIEAVSLLRRQMPIRLKIFGKGEYRRALQDLSEELGATEEVDFMGYVSQEKLLEEIEKADAGVVALLNEYQSPNKLFELVAMRKPVVASSLQTIRQHFSGDSLEYFRVGDAKNLATSVLELYQNPSRRASLVANASRIYEKYRWSKMKKRYLKIYEDLANGNES